MKRRIFAIIILILMFIPVLCLPTFSADDSLPKGFVKTEKIFDLQRGEGTQPFEYSKVDGFYLVLDHVTSNGFGQFYGDDGIYGKDPKLVAYQTAKQTLSAKPSITVYRDKVTEEGFTVTGTWDWKHTYGEGSIHSPGENEVCRSNISLSISNIIFDTYNIYADLSGTLHSEGGSNDSYDEVYETTLNGTQIRGNYHQVNEDGVISIFMYFCVGENGRGNGSFRDGILWFRIAGVLPKKGTTISGTTQNANENSGEDGGVSVPGAIVVGVFGGGAALAGAAAITANSSSENTTDDKKKKSYKMYVQKDFGDSIRRGGEKPVVIRARMVEVDSSGVETDRNDLSSQIVATSENMIVHSSVFDGRYCKATVSVSNEYENDEASITFTFTGAGGSFTNTVIFRIVDGPSLKFIDDEDGKLCNESCGIEIIPGDGFTYRKFFMILDAPVVPTLKDITTTNTGDFDVKIELTDKQSVYEMIVKNNTKPEPEHDIFEKVKNREFEIHVKVEGEKELIKGYVGMIMYPIGITISSSFEGKKGNVKYIKVQAYEKEYVGDLDRKWQVSNITFTLAVLGKDKAIINPNEAKYTFNKLKGSGGLGMRADKEQCLAEKYKYKESSGYWNDKFTYEFEPNANLAEPDDGTFMMVILPTICEYDGKKYEAEIPLRLRGKDPDPLGDWNKEYKDLERRIEKFSLPENRAKLVHNLKVCASEPRASVQELRATSKWILREYMNYWTTEQDRAQAEATMYNVIVNVLEWTKFAGDCAFSFLVAAYAGPVAEALISPAKDFITGAIGEIIAARNYGENIDVDKFEFSKNLAAAGDNLVSNSIDLTNWRKAAATLGGYFCYCAVKNYLLKLREKNESDFFGSLCEAFKDMTAAALKSKAGELIGKWLKDSKTFQEKIGPKITAYFKETNFDTLQKKLNDSLGLEGDLRKLAGYSNDIVYKTKIGSVVEKYLTELVGQGCAKVREIYDGSKFGLDGAHVTYSFQIDIADAFHFGITLDLTKILLSMSCPLFGWFYDYFFSNVPSAVAAIEVPKDPPLPPAKK